METMNVKLQSPTFTLYCMLTIAVSSVGVKEKSEAETYSTF
jgi:hypothetical protein